MAPEEWKEWEVDSSEKAERGREGGGIDEATEEMPLSEFTAVQTLHAFSEQSEWKVVINRRSLELKCALTSNAFPRQTWPV